jgi:hypothetical protein
MACPNLTSALSGSTLAMLSFFLNNFYEGGTPIPQRHFQASKPSNPLDSLMIHCPSLNGKWRSFYRSCVFGMNNRSNDLTILPKNHSGRATTASN